MIIFFILIFVSVLKLYKDYEIYCNQYILLQSILIVFFLIQVLYS